MTKLGTVLFTASLATLLAIFAPTPVALADIFKWEYINPANPGLGKQPSATLAPDGAGVNAVPGVSLSNRNLTKAYLIGADLTDAYSHGANLTDAELSQANLTNAFFNSATLTGANLTGAEVREARFSDSNITPAQLHSTASYLAHDLTAIHLSDTNLSGVNLVGQNLTGAVFANATLTGADFTGAEVRWAIFYNSNSFGFTAAQLYSTGSYVAHDLTGIGFYNNDLTDANLAGQNLTNARFYSANLTNANFSQANLTGAIFSGATLTGANLTGAEVREATFNVNEDFLNDFGTGITTAQLYSTASYLSHDLTGIGLNGSNLADVNLAGQNLANARFKYATLTNANFSQANLTNADFYGATLTGANLTGAVVRGATFYYSLLSAAQLYSTASYQAHDLSGIKLIGSYAGLNFAGQNLTGATFGSTFDGYSAADLTGANLSQANLTNANFAGYSYPFYNEDNQYIGDIIVPGANLTGANLSGADARGADFQYAFPSGAINSNLIQSSGRIAGLDLTAGASLVARDYDGNPAVSAIVIDQHVAMDATGTLRLVFDADSWDSTISFAPGIPVALGGTLELTFAPGVDVAAQSGRTIDLFDWTGVTPAGVFTVSSPYTWDLSNLYTTGEVTLVAVPIIPGDFNGDSVVDAADLAQWKGDFGLNGDSDSDGDGDSDGADFLAWQRQLGATPTIAAATATVPEPATLLLVVSGAFAMMLRRRVAVS